jgi:hypothetical protein
MNQHEIPDIKKALTIQYRNINVVCVLVYAVYIIEELGLYSKNILVAVFGR